jgi:hypothetical protein
MRLELDVIVFRILQAAIGVMDVLWPLPSGEREA